MNPEHRLSEIGQIAITVSDVDSALTFYRDALGLPFLFRAGPNLAFLAAGGVRIMLSTPQGAGQVGHNSILYFKVADIGAVHAAVVGRGAANEREPQLAAKMPDHELWTGFRARSGRERRGVDGGEAVAPPCRRPPPAPPKPPRSANVWRGTRRRAMSGRWWAIWARARRTSSRAIAAGLGAPPGVTSPTFTLVHEYPGGRLPLFHFDLYRLRSAEEALHLGWEEYLDAGGLTVVEWADRFPALLPPGTRWFQFEILAGDARRIVAK